MAPQDDGKKTVSSVGVVVEKRRSAYKHNLPTASENIDWSKSSTVDVIKLEEELRMAEAGIIPLSWWKRMKQKFLGGKK